MPETRTYTVAGMTCDHCVRSVTAELEKLDGVVGVAIDLASGQVTVSAAPDLDDATVTAAVDEAGYEVTS